MMRVPKKPLPTLPVRSRLTLEGGYCLFVLAFIVGGAVLREVNLLVLLAGLLTAPFLLSWLWGRIALFKISIFRTSDDRVFANEPLRVHWGIAPARWTTPTWNVVIMESWSGAEGPSRRSERVRLVIPRARLGQVTWDSYAVAFPERGKVTAGPATISTRFPLGLFESYRTITHSRQLVVWPERGQLTPQWHQLLQRLRVGQQLPLSQRGMADGEYYGLREWRPGDSRRWIHWRTSARLGTLTVREFQQQRDESLALLVDLCRRDEQQREPIERVVSFLATVVEDRRRQRLPIRLVLRGETVHQWRGTVNDVLAQEILDVLATVEPRCADATPDDLPGDGPAEDRWLRITTDPRVTGIPPGRGGLGTLATPEMLSDWFRPSGEGDDRWSSASAALAADATAPTEAPAP